MKPLMPFDSTSTWVRLVYKGATIGVDRWPGPHGPGSVIRASGGGQFLFDHADPDAAEGPEAVYVWNPTN